MQRAVAEGKDPGDQWPDEAMTAFCLTTVTGLQARKREEFAVKRAMQLPFSTAERNELFLPRSYSDQRKPKGMRSGALMAFWAWMLLKGTGPVVNSGTL